MWTWPRAPRSAPTCCARRWPASVSRAPSSSCRSARPRVTLLTAEGPYANLVRVAAAAHAAGEGACLDLAVFNRVESGFSYRFAAPARVLTLRDGQGIGRRGTAAGRRFDLGASALLELAGSGLRVVVGGLRRQLHEPRLLEMHGIDIAAARCVVVKSRGHFRAGVDECFPPGPILEADAPGPTSPVLANFDRKRLSWPVFPLESEAAWQG